SAGFSEETSALATSSCELKGLPGEANAEAAQRTRHTATSNRSCIAVSLVAMGDLLSHKKPARDAKRQRHDSPLPIYTWPSVNSCVYPPVPRWGLRKLWAANVHIIPGHYFSPSRASAVCTSLHFARTPQR